MSFIACPECGLPRSEEQAGTACPVCAVPAEVARPARVKPDAPEPTAGLPADAGELHRSAASDPAFPRWMPWAAVFLLGAVVGAAGSFGWQTAPTEVANRAAPDDETPEDLAPVSHAAPAAVGTIRLDLAPLPHEPVPPPLELAPAPRAAAGPPRPQRVITLEFNDPNLIYTVPSDLRKNKWVILKGKVKALKIAGLEGGSVLDASGLEVGTVTVSGRIAGGSVLRLNAPGGFISFADGVSSRAVVEVTAPGGEVVFPRENRPARLGSQIDGGSTVTITAKRVELRGDVTGDGTRVTVNLTAGGRLWADAVRGVATVEYRTPNGPGKPSASAGTVDPTATFKQIE